MNAMDARAVSTTPDQAMDAARQLERFMLDSIPLARALKMEIAACDGERIEVRAPLAANVNDKGCAFGGSLSSLMTLAPWALLELVLRQHNLHADVFVADAEIRYRAPIFEDIRVVAQPGDGHGLDRFVDTLRQRGRARIGMLSVVGDPDNPACIQQARFVAKLRR